MTKIKLTDDQLDILDEYAQKMKDNELNFLSPEDTLYLMSEWIEFNTFPLYWVVDAESENTEIKEIPEYTRWKEMFNNGNKKEILNKYIDIVKYNIMEINLWGEVIYESPKIILPALTYISLYSLIKEVSN